MSRHLFKVWSSDRNKKAVVVVSEDDIYNYVVLKASEKLNINGSSLVLNADGTTVDDDEVLLAVKNEILLLLSTGEKWSSEVESTTSLPTTATNSGASSNVRNWLNNQADQLANNSDDTNLNLFDDSSLNLEKNPSTQQVVNVQIIDCNAEFLWTAFEIPWHKMPGDLVILCEQGKPCPELLSDIVHIVVNELRQIKPQIPSHVLKTVANKMVQKYPSVFKDTDDDGVTVGDGSTTLFLKLYERASYLRRPHKQKRSLADKNVAPALKKKKVNVMAGCSNWAPDETELTQEGSFGVDTAKSKLKDLVTNNFIARTDEFLNFMEMTYPQQRQYLNDIQQPPTVQMVKADWPVIFTINGIIWHFDKLTGSRLEDLATNLQLKAKKIVHFFKTQKRMKHYINRTELDNPRDLELVALRLLALYFKEDFEKFYQIRNVNSPCEDEVPSLNPFILQNKSETNEEVYEVYLEKQLVLTCKEFLEALKAAFGFFFIFNLQYPKELSTFLEMIQRYFLKIHPDAGSKSKKMSISKKNVIALIKKLN